MALWRVRTGRRIRWALGPADDGPRQLLAEGFRLDDALGGNMLTATALADAVTPEPVGDHTVLAPVESQEVWAAGVTYLRSRDARKLESGSDIYDLVYEAERPELFLKATAGRVVGPGEAIGIRRDSGWDVPEPEVAVLADRSGAIVAYAIGNDVSSRSIEGANPLYLPQAKFYDGSCAVGPCLVPAAEVGDPRGLEIELVVRRDGVTEYADLVRVSDMARTMDDLVRWLYASLTFPHGVFLLTGTAIVPPPEFTLRESDSVSIEITGLGRLTNPVAFSTGSSAPGS